MADRVPIRNKEKDAKPRGMQATEAWKPALDRRQSWNKEDQKRAVQMTGVVDQVKTGAGAGFTEKAA